MARGRRYLDTDVLTEARDRILDIYRRFDSVVVCFSGGKDSLATLELTWEIAQELGRDHVDVIFRDEELIPDEVLDFVDEYRQKPWVKMLWFCVPLKSQKYCLGQTVEYIQWDPARPWIREKPPWGITMDDPERVLSQYTMDAYQGSFFRGKVALLTGMRASESLMRYQSVMMKLVDSHIVGSAQASRNVNLCRPIYDWSENDVFRYFYDKGLAYCPIYDSQTWNGEAMRVSTPVHAESAKKFHMMRSRSPVLYEQVVTLFPEMLAHERYYRDLKTSHEVVVVETYDDIRRWIFNNVKQAVQRRLALQRVSEIEANARTHPENYPVMAAMAYFQRGAYKRAMMPMRAVHA